MDGFVLSSNTVGTLTLKELASGKFPVVTYQMPSDICNPMPVTSVRIDNRNAYRELLRHLKETGRRRFVIIGMGNSNNSRHEQCRKCASELNLAIQDSDVLLLPKEEVRAEPTLGTYLAVLKHWEKLKQYDAWIMSNDLMARGACAALRHFKYEPGREIAVTGYDNMEESRLYLFQKPMLTTIRPPLNLLGTTCAQLLLEQIRAPGAGSKEIKLHSELVIRQSSHQTNYKEEAP